MSLISDGRCRPEARRSRTYSFCFSFGEPDDGGERGRSSCDTLRVNGHAVKADSLLAGPDPETGGVTRLARPTRLERPRES